MDGFIANSCCGRSYDIGTSGLTPITDDVGDYINKIRTWLAVVWKVMDESHVKCQ